MKPFEPIHNPYIVGNPIRGTKMFFGREDDFAYIQTKITGEKDGGLIVLCGARRSGKTSILFQIQEGRLGPEFLPVLVDMQSMAIKNDRDFLEKVARSIIASGEPTESQVETYSLAFEDNPFAAFEQFIIGLAERLGDKKLVLTFDEYELIETHIDNGVLDTQVLGLLGNLIEHKKIFVVFTGSDKLEARNKKYWEFLSKGLNRRISFLTRQDTLRLIREPVAGVVEYGEDIPEAIADLTAGQPFYTQVLCQSIVDHLNEEHSNDVSEDDLRLVVEDVIANPLPQMIFHWNQLSVLEKLCLSIIAEINKHELKPATADDVAEFLKTEKTGYRADTADLKKSLESLFKGDLLVKAGSEDTYEFKMGLWRSWITRMHSVWRVIDEMEREKTIPTGLVSEGKIAARRWLYAAVAVVAIAAVALAARQFWPGGAAGPPGALNATTVEYAKLDLRSTPADAEVWVDGTRLGWTPLNDSIPVGAHQVEVLKAGYHARADSVDLSAGTVWDTTFALEPITGSVVVRSTPPGARVWLDGEDTGLSTPAQLEGIPVVEAHDVSLVLDGFNRYTFPPVDVPADSTVVIARDLSRRTAPLRVVSEPPGASFDLGGGKWRGATPFALTNVAHGTHTLRVMVSGYETWEQNIVVPYPDNEIVANLTRLPDGYFRFMIQPVGDVYIDGVRVRSEISFGLVPTRPGSHNVEIKLGDSIHSETFELSPGDTLTIRHNFGG